MHRIEIVSKVPDTRAQVRKKKLERAGFKIKDVKLVDAYLIESEKITPELLEKLAEGLRNPVVQDAFVNEPVVPEDFSWAVEVGFLPGVTDNVGNTVRREVSDLFESEGTVSDALVASSQVMFVSGDLTEDDAESIAAECYNPVIQRAPVKSREQFLKDNGMNTDYPHVRISKQPTADIVDILNADDDELKRIGKSGIFDHVEEISQKKYDKLKIAYAKDGSWKLGDLSEKDSKFLLNVRRGPLALDLTYMKAIQSYFRNNDRNPTDVELESLAQTWSEHCKHTIFADPITMTFTDGSTETIGEGIFKRFIRGATEKIRKQKGDKDSCVSLFTDNSGVIKFDNKWNICYKVETHNSPSALDPFGGAITGIVGVNRDPFGTRRGAKCFVNVYGYCFADPKDDSRLFKGEDFTQEMLSAERIDLGVIDGVNVGGNCSGIPTPIGFSYYDKRFRGKPLVFVGTGGLLPVETGTEVIKQAKPGDYIVMVGGRVGKDGIHGATFSSEAMDAGSPATAVQIGDPITQKKMHDAIIFEARDRGLYNSITDNGAGGLSCSVAEMARECGGCYVKLDDVPLKYPGMMPWEIWISESQERMTLSVPKEKWAEFSDLMKRRDVEATVIGEFNDSGKCVVDYAGKTVMDVDLDFLHDGLPERPLNAVYKHTRHEEPVVPVLEDLTDSFYSMIERLNVCSHEFISQQYDHEVQGGSVLKPLQGKGRVNGDAAVVRPVLSSRKGVIMSQGVNPSYSDIDTYHMAACAIDTAVRRAVCAGADMDDIHLLDNFCWSSSNDSQRLGELWFAAKACHDVAVDYNTPFISGKDSMFNDFKGYDENNNPVKISVPPTLLVSTMSVMDDVRKVVSLDAKFATDLVYTLGTTSDELGGSEYFRMIAEKEGRDCIGNHCPVVDTETNSGLYRALHECIDDGIVASAKSVDAGGLGIALAKTAMGGRLGMEVCLDKLPGDWSRDDNALFSESMGRVVVTVSPEYRDLFEERMKNHSFAQVGVMRSDGRFVVKSREREIVNADIASMLEPYRATLRDY